MKVHNIYPVLMSDRVAETAAFYRSHFGFQTTFAADWYVSLRHEESPHHELAILKSDHRSVPRGHRATACGVLINVEVADVEAEYKRLIEMEMLPLQLELRDEEWGQRHFITSDPSGNLIDVIQNIEVAASYEDAYVDASRAAGA